MTERSGKIMKKCFACVMILVMGLSACTAQNWDPESWFPLWEEAGEAPENQEGVAIGFLSIKPYPMDSWPERTMGPRPEEEWLMLLLQVRAKEDIWLPSPPGWWIDFYYESAWHTVYRERLPAVDDYVVHGRAAGFSEVGAACPAWILEKPGKYRLCYKEMGTFPFTVFASKIWG